MPAQPAVLSPRSLHAAHCAAECAGPLRTLRMQPKLGAGPTKPQRLPRRPAAVDGKAGAGDGGCVIGAQVPHQRAHLHGSV